MRKSFLNEIRKKLFSVPRNDIETSSPESFTLKLTRYPTRIMPESLIPSLCSEWMRCPFSVSARAFSPGSVIVCIHYS